MANAVPVGTPDPKGPQGGKRVEIPVQTIETVMPQHTGNIADCDPNSPPLTPSVDANRPLPGNDGRVTVMSQGVQNAMREAASVANREPVQTQHLPGGVIRQDW